MLLFISVLVFFSCTVSVGGSSGGGGNNKSGNDIISPTLLSTSVNDDSINVAINLNSITLVFSEAVLKGSGSIRIYNYDDDSLIGTVDTTNITIDTSLNTNVIINLSGAGITLPPSRHLYILIDSTLFKDASSNHYAGISLKDMWDFITDAAPDITAPSILTCMPFDDSLNVSTSLSQLSITFDENVYFGTGNIVLYESGVGIVEVITSSNIIGDGTANILIPLSVSLNGLTDYYVHIDGTLFRDASDNYYTGISDDTTWNFTTLATPDVTPPSVNSFTPIDGAIDVSNTLSQLQITFSENVIVASGNVTLYESGVGAVETIPASSITGNGTADISIPISITLNYLKDYYIQIDPTLFKDASDNYYPGITDNITWNFTTKDNESEINIKENGTDIPDGTSGYNIGSTPAGTPKMITFTVENTGVDPLNLTGTPRVVLTNSMVAAYSLTQDAPVSITSGGEGTFTITLNYATAGTYSATVSIASDDNDENPYNFTITGTVTGSEINVKYTADGSNVDSGSNHNYGDVANPFDFEYTIENLGNEDLTPVLSISGSALYSVIKYPDATVSPGGTTTFIIHFTGDGAPPKVCNVTISNNDYDEGAYTFTIRAR
jgi:hypothetical protein